MNNNIDDFLNELYENWIDMVIDTVPLVRNMENNFNRRHFINNGLNIYTNRYHRNTNPYGPISRRQRTFDIMHLRRNGESESQSTTENYYQNSNYELMTDFLNIRNEINRTRSFVNNYEQPYYNRQEEEQNELLYEQQNELNEEQNDTNEQQNGLNNNTNEERQHNFYRNFYQNYYQNNTGENTDISNLLTDLFGNIFDFMTEPVYEDVKVTISENDFQKLKTIKITHENIDKYKDKECNICLDSFNLNNDIKLLPCNHFFHNNCIHDWLCNEKINCPVCRKDVRECTNTNNN